MSTSLNEQQGFAQYLQTLSPKTLDVLCNKDFCRLVFGLKRPLLLKIPVDTPIKEKYECIQNKKGEVLYHWRFEFHKGSHAFALTTEWSEDIKERIQVWSDRL